MFLTTRAYCIHKSVKLTASHVLCAENKDRTVKVLSSLSDIRTSKVSSSKKAAVFVPICLVNNEISLLLTIRSMHLKNNRGQVAYPGGMHDSNDKSLEETAMRETKEEIGLPKDVIEVWGKGPSIGREDMVVTPYLGYVGEIDPKSLRINPNEVESAFTESLETFCDPKVFRTTTFRSKHGRYVLPTFITPKFRIWGLTALITHTVLHALLPDEYRNKVALQVMTSQELPSMKKS